ncbi:MAG: DNA/RNA non-specific endonuclease, partial [Candidatus Latescibacterota bacterium]|nr:DNA/RNA non-specific endonuclease [Candidatus Latescibacterota bacterium]
YNEEHEQAEWVAYIITRQQLSQRVDRTDDFRSDPAVDTGSAALADYERSGFDRGHLAPAASMAWSMTIMSESFFLSNMSPQVPGFNRGIWRKLEEAVRKEAYQHEELVIITGPLLEPNLPTIGSNRVSIPEAYFKALLDITNPSIEGIAFLLENKSSNKPLKTFASTIDSLESITGINFFVNLEDDVENEIENSVNMSHWKSIQ